MLESGNDRGFVNREQQAISGEIFDGVCERVLLGSWAFSLIEHGVLSRVSNGRRINNGGWSLEEVRRGATAVGSVT